MEYRVISRSDAIACGLKRYFTGVPCPKGHISERLVSSRGCARCTLDRRIINWRRVHGEPRRRRPSLRSRRRLERPQVCEICGDAALRINFDHCHKTGLFRGWLCTRCNLALGLTMDSPEILRDLAFYLEKSIGSFDYGGSQEAANERFCWASAQLSCPG